MKYKLTNKWGNVIMYASTEREKNHLVKQGYIIDQTYGAKKTTIKREKKENVKNGAENQD